MTHDPRHDEQLPDALRFGLRALRQDVAPANDLWPSIAQRIAATPQVAPAPVRRSWRPLAPLAMAASLALAVGIAWQVRPPESPVAQSAPIQGRLAQTRPVQTRLIAREAEAMTLEYQAALKVIDAVAPTAGKTAPELQVLDQSAAQIRTALARDPNARFLLNRLQSTYTRRLELTQRMARTSLAS
jgi:hypothetical protein